ncbi:hypothetical protein [Proteus sp. CA142267]|uniref:hypothetical protein n=1 Tax=Proteus sp. CA142267 TaxID=2050965 RepID=UPI000D6E86CC|nr:hypothetical protein [Proteus sp. CA142267]
MLQENKIDVWLQRVGNISQIGVLIVMVVTIFYTVIPLYRTASLEESIAKKEGELKLLVNKLSEMEKREKALQRHMALSQYTVSVSLRCTSLSNTEQITSASSENINDTIIKRELTKLNQDIEGCLKKTEYVDPVMNILSQNDKVTFKKELNLLAERVSKLRQENINKYYEVEKSLNNNEIDINFENDSFLENSFNSLARAAGISEEDIDRGNKLSYLSSVEAGFEEEIRQEIYKFRKIKWND